MMATRDMSLPPQKGVPPLRQWPLLAAMTARALVELARGRVALRRITVKKIQLLNAQAGGEADPHFVAWVAFTIPRVARRVPFRSDCLVQALAAQHWLASRSIASKIVLGGALPEGKPFAAHAWLTSEDCVVTGGAVEDYTILV